MATAWTLLLETGETLWLLCVFIIRSHTGDTYRYRYTLTHTHIYLLYFCNSCCVTPLGASGPIWNDQQVSIFIQRTGELPENQNCIKRSPGIALICLQSNAAVLIWYNWKKNTPTQTMEKISLLLLTAALFAHHCTSLLFCQPPFSRGKGLLLLSGLIIRAHSEKGELMV